MNKNDEDSSSPPAPTPYLHCNLLIPQQHP